jgi:Holliday junction resolvase RusA-like endonuclease
MDWLQEAYAILKQAKIKTIHSPYKLTVLAKRPDKRKRDIDNIASKAVNDALQSGGVVADDCQCQWLEAKWVEEGPPFLIIVETLDESDGHC